MNIGDVRILRYFNFIYSLKLKCLFMFILNSTGIYLDGLIAKIFVELLSFIYIFGFENWSTN